LPLHFWLWRAKSDNLPKPIMKRVIVAISGGIDSGVAAALLKESGFEVIGAFMRLWQEPAKASFNTGPKGRGPEFRARELAKILKIPLFVFDFKKEFRKKIVDYFLKEYKKGETPNPCVVCNREIKFGLLLKKAQEIGADFIATGHYARKEKDRKTGLFNLLRAKDKNKDQSYFLWQLEQKQLSRVLFPVGDYKRVEVEKMAKKLKLAPILGIKKSLEICFVEKGVNEFLKKHLKEKKGKVVTEKGEVIGEHPGIWFFTIGQRKRIVSCLHSQWRARGPFYVLAKEKKTNTLIVTRDIKKVFQKGLALKRVNWISGKKPKFPLRVMAKIRYRQNCSRAMVKPLSSKKYILLFKRPQKAATPGQSAVFYQGNKLLGGGIIE